MPADWVVAAVSAFGATAKAKLAGPGDREAAIRTPLEQLLTAAGQQLQVHAVFHDEVRDDDRRVRPDYALSVDGVISGYVEVKAPGRAIDPDNFTGHDLQQWTRQRDLPNLLYTNGTEWRLYRDSQPHGEPVRLSGGALTTAGTALTAGDDLESLLTEFLRWRPAPITSVIALVRAIAPLTRLLRGEVLDQLGIENGNIAAGADRDDQPFLGLARDWRSLLFPDASDDVFADGYAQTVAFALLLARTESIDVSGSSLHTVGDQLGDQHSLMGTALQLLTDRIAGDFKVTLDLLVRVVGAVQWDRVRRGRRDTYLHLYERFLDEYDQDLRKASGSYYTPRNVVEEMVRLTEQALTTRLGKTGFDDPTVLTVDPAMGTGTYLHTIIERVAARAAARDGAGIVPGVVTDLAARLVGFELQMGPYAVAELRTTDLLRTEHATPPADGLRLYVTNTLDNPHVATEQLSSGFTAISRSRRRANTVKATTPVTVVIGNPPYRERAEGLGGWVETGDAAANVPAPLDAFRAEGNGLAEYVLKNLYVYFWRWATHKVFDDPTSPAGIVCFISTSGYLRGPGFRGMREYLRRTASEGWVIDLTPEGIRPDVATRIFPGVQQPLAIGLFIRADGTDQQTPAVIHHSVLGGHQRLKFEALTRLDLEDASAWRTVRPAWQAPFTPAADSDWDTYPALDDLLPWTAPGIGPNRTWVYAPHPEPLRQRWSSLVLEQKEDRKRVLFKESRDASLEHARRPLSGSDVHQFSTNFKNETRAHPAPIRVGYRSLDRQWVIPDARLLHAPSPHLWAARVPGQIFFIEQHSKVLQSGGPGLVTTDLIPDKEHFNNRGGRVLPLLHPDKTANLPAGLLAALGALHGSTEVTAVDVAAYITAVVAHPGFTETFADELTTPGVRVPITTDRTLWYQAVALGRQAIWLQTYGAAQADTAAGRPVGDVRLSSGHQNQPLSVAPVTSMPDTIRYDASSQVLHVGDGQWAPVPPRAWAYEVGGRSVLKSWFNYRKANPAGRRSSPLDDINVDAWPLDWTRELTDLLTVLVRLAHLEPKQADLLGHILAGTTANIEDLRLAGVRWPTSKSDRTPRYPATPAEGQLPL